MIKRLIREGVASFLMVIGVSAQEETCDNFEQRLRDKKECVCSSDLGGGTNSPRRGTLPF